MDKGFWHKIIELLRSTRMFFWALVCLIVLLVLGTLVQKEIGLYQAQEIYFASWVVWLGGFVPVPGAMSVMAVMTAGLAVRTFTDQWIWAKAGIILTHFAALILLIGGFVTAASSEEGALVLAEGEGKAYVADYFDLELVFGDWTLEVGDWSEGRVIRSDDLPFDITVDSFENHAEPVLVNGVIGISPLPRLAAEEENLSAISLNVLGEKLVVFEGLPMPVKVKHDGIEYHFELRPVRRALPFTVELLDFEKQVYPGTQDAQSYHSDVIVREGALAWQSRIKMNEPLRYKGYTFYQSSFLRGDMGEMTVLAVVKNAGRLFPYIASILLAAGLLVHLFQRWPLLMKKVVLVVGILLMQSGGNFALAQERISMDGFSQLPILYEGRVQPMDSFARSLLHDFSGHDSLGAMSARAWLSVVIFAPDIARDIPVFRVRDADVIYALGLPEASEKRLYSFAALREAMRAKKEMIEALEMADNKGITSSQRYVLDLQEKMLIYIDISHALSIDMPDKDQSFPASFFRVIPQENNEWITPWMVTSRGEKTHALLSLWGDLALAFRTQNTQAWNTASDALTEAMRPYGDGARLQAEWFYEQIDLHGISLMFYVAAGLALLLGARGRFISLGLVIGGAALHLAGLVLRVYILARPPVTTLYESVLFVGVIVVILGLIIEVRNRRGLGLFIAAVAGAALQLIGQSYAGEAETMAVLVPVLNTNFWLATHVIVITIGYGACFVTGLMAHVNLFGRLRGGDVSALDRAVIAFGLLALLFTVTGTILGGIWADQSWGRFWGWDPKENGAMLICLWIILMLHGRLAGVINPAAFMAGMAFLNVVVALAWFGVNLLSVGLHSYGFVDGIALALFLFVAAEVLVIGFALVFIRYKHKRAVT
jgi:ABC-type transport system involved in cytochrome c biogenesis permease subunit